MSKKALNKMRSQLSTFERIISLVLTLLEKSFFRSTPMYFGFVTAIVVGTLILVTAYYFGYQIVSMTILGYVFAIGFIVGFIYEYIRSMAKQIK